MTAEPTTSSNSNADGTTDAINVASTSSSSSSVVPSTPSIA
eukprot:CAMPEP_0196241554 /NCGR_PEP_ID=MMETSP0913-20130531/21813_1 /TAXON_ID=49265 /ORGANISM="Thalassiosira rotula, Strain GSO102" /LENGTH=40 /DNA_ID= /DNA_START= /DNA_END= /DNA_ORIENTATION=